MYPPKKVAIRFSPQEISIIQRAKAHGIDFLSNEYLAKELFSLHVENKNLSQIVDKVLKVEKLVDEAINLAQMSSEGL
ncbi:hypothetical protein ACKGJI_09245 [Sulfurospirillum sp. 1307]|jgi:type III secretion system FlhB-like substrate exporter